MKYALREVRELYGRAPAAEFGPKALAAVREAMVRKGWSRPYTNAQVRRVVRAFKWAAGEEIIPAPLYVALRTLAPLRAGKTDAPETEPRLPADPVAVAATLPHLPPHVRALVELLRLTGMRPSEACRMTLGRIDRSADLWVYAPAKHKTAHKGKGRAVTLGPAAQAVIVAHLGGKVLGPDEPLFSPRRQRDERFATMRAVRKSKVQPSQASRKKAKPKRVPGEWFTYHVLGHAVNVAARKAGVKEWSPYQLRHLKGAELREEVQPRTRAGGAGALARQHERALRRRGGRGAGGGGGGQGGVMSISLPSARRLPRLTFPADSCDRILSTATREVHHEGEQPA